MIKFESIIERVSEIEGDLSELANEILGDRKEVRIDHTYITDGKAFMVKRNNNNEIIVHYSNWEVEFNHLSVNDKIEIIRSLILSDVK